MPARLVDARWPVSLAFAALLVVAWQLAGMSDALPRYVLSPTEILAGFVALLGEGELLPAIGNSLRRQVSGFVLGATVGVLIGLLAGVFRAAEDLFDTMVSLTYPLPKIALFPVVVVWLGFTDTARILIISLSCFYPSFVNAFAGTRGIDPRVLWVARNVGASRTRTFRQVVFRAAMPSIVTGVRISLALSFVLTFATESIGASRGGLGYLIEEGFNNLFYDWMYVAILCFALLGFLADRLWLMLAGRLLHGQQAMAVGRV